MLTNSTQNYQSPIDGNNWYYFIFSIQARSNQEASISHLKIVIFDVLKGMKDFPTP